MTSSSSTWVKSSQYWPTASKSAAPAGMPPRRPAGAPGQRLVRGHGHGADQPGRFALAQAVQRGGHGGPVARPSSTTMTMRLATSSGGRIGVYCARPLVDPAAAAGAFGGDVMRIGARRCGVRRRQYGPAALIDRADGVFGLVGRAQLAHQHSGPDRPAALGRCIAPWARRRRNGQHQGGSCGIGL